MFEFDPERAAVGLLENFYDLLQRGFGEDKVIGGEALGQVAAAETEFTQTQLRVVKLAGGQGVDAGIDVADFSITPDQGLNGSGFLPCFTLTPTVDAEFEPLEEDAPFLRDLSRVLLVLQELRFDPLGADIICCGHRLTTIIRTEGSGTEAGKQNCFKYRAEPGGLQ